MMVSTSSLRAEIETHLTWLRESLPGRVVGPELSARSKVPFKAVSCRAVLGWRALELSEATLDSLAAGRVLSSAVLTRAAIETVAGVWYLSRRLHRAVAENSLGNIDERLMRLLVGSKINSEMRNPVHINDFIACAEQEVPGFEAHYNRLSEFAHPNWAGTMYLFSQPEPEERAMRFGPNVRGFDSATIQCLTGLSGALLMLRAAYDEITAVIPQFAAICESDSGRAV
jgi:hypothetical protein